MPNIDLQSVPSDPLERVLNHEDLHLDPFNQFKKWMDKAWHEGVFEPTAMCLATTDAQGQPHNRMLNLKTLDDKGFVFFTHYNSPKAQDLVHNPKASILFYWPQLKRQVRIEGIVEKISPEESQSFFTSQPFETQLALLSSHQSEPVPGRKTIELNFLLTQAEQQGSKLHCPDTWGGYCLKPHLFEFLQRRAHQMDDRFVYQKAAKNNLASGHAEHWLISRLAP
ncbi:pyridoxamine 5'-phosphate oxidase [Thiosulfativibrio zosterae]|uniref:Pyridoxamine 5'-phosphate oxidase n=1 Tax=Thiosulfativibrio zosterae TaxID=2675053 RepID=A0A6F8PQC2_9GAMM|nr:pyridoxamine 5'-phosphate oxidase [Thiosulfativibrio zosterae]BBP44227.1 pyridoxine/pyridoxamine 5'-phosphate oxidase [Thiosulfativibrio zosterae]